LKKLLKDRYFILALAFIAMGCIIVHRLFNLQIVMGDSYLEDSKNRILKERKIPAPRGKILDRTGIPIAVNDQGFILQIYRTGLKSQELNRVLHEVIKILDKNGDEYYTPLEKYLSIYPVNYKTDKETVKKWLADTFGLDEDETPGTALDTFKFLQEYFGIDASYTNEQAFKIMNLRYEILMNNWSFITFNPVTLSDDICRNSVAEIEERHHELMGVTTEVVPVRRYIDANDVAHVLGYVGYIDSEKLEEWKDDGYGSKDIVGMTGIELTAEKILRGTNGRREVELDMNGRLTSILFEEPAVPGNDVVLTIDKRLQEIAMESLARNIEIIRSGANGKDNRGDANAGSVVAIDVNSGKILVMASYPSYDPSVFLPNKANEKDVIKTISQLMNDNENKPLLNRTIQQYYAPGSTFKPLVAIAALEEGVITPYTYIQDNGMEEIGGMKFYCLEYRYGHGPLQLDRALATSCNIYFHKVGVLTTIDKIDKWAKMFGLGEKTGVELPYEKAGNRANRQFKMDTFGEQWWMADTAQAAIGQLYNQFTPLQIANYVATIANGGKRYKPYIIDKVIDHDGNIVSETKPEYEQLPVSEETLAAVKKGMRSVASSVDGTAEKVFRDFPVEVAGKTGTAETGLEAEHSSNALFVCFAPANNPQIAVAVVIERGVWGSYTAPVARDVLAAYFNLYGDGLFKPEDTHNFIP